MKPRSLRLLSLLLALTIVHVTHADGEAARKKKSGPTLEPVIVFGDGESKTVRFVEKHNRLYLPVTIPPGETGYFIIDTGMSGSSALRSDLVKAMGLERYKDRRARNLGKTFDVVSWRLEAVRFGGRRHKDQFVRTFDGWDRNLRSESARVGLDVIGILSVKFMEPFLIRIDYDAGLITLDPLPAASPCATCGDDAVCAPVTYVPSDRNIRVEVHINDLKAPIVLALDTGAPLTVISQEILERLGESRTRELGFSGETQKSRLGAFGGGGGFKEEWVRVDSFAVADARLENFPLDMMTRTTLSDMRIAGLLGANFLRNFDVTLDLKHKCLVLEKNANYDTRGGRP